MSLDRASALYLWLHALASEFIQGSATAFLVVSGGSTVGQAAYDLPSMGLKSLAFTVLMGGAVGAFGFLKKTPLPEPRPVPSP
jgi:hypothetical protein